MARRVNLLTRGTAQVGALLIGTTDPALTFRGAAAPTDGTSGTGAGEAGKGSRYLDTTNGNAYQNIGTKASPVWLLVGGDTVFRYITTALTNALLLAARATPIALTPAAPAGYRWNFVTASWNQNNTGAYTESADNFAVKYENGSGVAVSETIESGGFLDQTGKIHTNIVQKKDVIVADAGATAKALVLHNTGDGELGGGDAANVGRIVTVAHLVATL